MIGFNTLLRGIGLGAGLMYFYDPDRGRRRRALLRDRFVHFVNHTESFFESARRDLNNRLTGIGARAGSLVSADGADDVVVAERVRSRLGRYASHPHALHVTCRDGCVTLSGPVLADEVHDLLCAVSGVRGVKKVENRMEVHQERGNVPALQGGAHRPGEHADVMQHLWSPATRVVMGSLGGVLLGACLARPTPGRALLGTAGFGMLLRAWTNHRLRECVGLSEERRVLDFQRTWHIAAPVARVFDFARDFEQFPHYLPNIVDVRDLGNGRLRWTACGPGGMEVRLEEEITELIPHERISWRSVPGSAFAFEGTARFEPEGENRTRVDVHFAYNPPGGSLGDLIAGLFHADPRHQHQESFLRIKTFLETGHPAHDAAVPLEEGAKA